jgi:Fic family protein
MKGHDVALKLVEDLAVDTERTLSENFIRELNKVILKEPFYKEAITPDGQPTRRLIKIGEYKSFPNSVRLQNGEIFNYTSPAETALQMGDLIKWYLDTSANQSIHPIELAAELHYRFVCIHPFDDGNGRLSRLIMNYHLLKNGYPPVIIKSADKKNYLFALHEADTGNLEAFKTYIAEQLIWSYNISIKAAKGESIDEPGDWEKKFTLLEKDLVSENSLKEIKNETNVYAALHNDSIGIVEILLRDFKKVNDMFFEYAISLKANDNIVLRKFTDIEELKSSLVNLYMTKQLPNLNTFHINYSLNDFKHNGLKTFSLIYSIVFQFRKLSYSIHIKYRTISSLIQKPYHQSLTTDELNKLANNLSDILIKDIQEQKSKIT